MRPGKEALGSWCGWLACLLPFGGTAAEADEVHTAKSGTHGEKLFFFLGMVATASLRVSSTAPPPAPLGVSSAHGIVEKEVYLLSSYMQCLGT